MAGQLIEWCPEAAVLSYNVLPNGTGKVSDTNAALADILKRVKADTSHQYIVNMSLGGGGSAVSPSIVQQGKLISQLVDENVPVCVSAGNDGKEAKLDVWPSCFHDPVCVAAINDNGAKANFSTWHNEMDVADAGVSIKGLSYTGASGVYMSGTSMSAPNVAGKIGLIMSKYYTDNGDWPSESAVYDTLKNNCIDLHKRAMTPIPVMALFIWMAQWVYKQHTAFAPRRLAMYGFAKGQALLPLLWRLCLKIHPLLFAPIMQAGTNARRLSVANV